MYVASYQGPVKFLALGAISLGRGISLGTKTTTTSGPTYGGPASSSGSVSVAVPRPSLGPTYGGSGLRAGATVAVPRGAAPPPPSVIPAGFNPTPEPTFSGGSSSGGGGSGGGIAFESEPAPEDPATNEVPLDAPFKIKWWHIALGVGALALIMRRRS